MDLNLKGKAVFVAASSKGLGKASALELAKEGANVMLSGRDEEELKLAKAVLEQAAAGKVEYVLCDITKPEQLKAAIQTTVRQFGTIDILVNNAGGPPAGTFEKFTDEDWVKAFELTLLSYIRLIREALPYMKEQRSGKIINLTSSSIKQPIPGLLLSNTFRLGVLGMAKTLSMELAPYNILVHTVAPGRIATDRVKSLDEIKAQQAGVPVEQVEADSKKTIPLGRYGNPEEFGKVVAFLASDAASYMTGSAVLVDGGMIKSL
ncbi:SDR family oxidoreductase [Paenibacillus beijingensis]|uniref:3-oxoacyl-ACP reductase n=1 Tax=Paenibacillus beijingensis TaxID=1126833 RepID=A0A0D5NHC9_9BACL|nr:SDR family oxidoreductase [Paenibacillus beijingensis]AJY74789.1 3-oxoacyl-ACP reductase [Paenibacillus beijingensis]